LYKTAGFQQYQRQLLFHGPQENSGRVYFAGGVIKGHGSHPNKKPVIYFLLGKNKVQEEQRDKTQW